MYIYDNFSLMSSENEKHSKKKLQRKSKHIFYAQRFSGKDAIYQIMSKNIVQPDRSQMIV